MSEMGERPQTFGEYRVGIRFNPGGNKAVDDIKRRAADFIDYINGLPKPEDRGTLAEVSRLIALASTHIEDAAMWAVKAVTKPTR
jgi:hypothetical protein